MVTTYNRIQRPCSAFAVILCVVAFFSCGQQAADIGSGEEIPDNLELFGDVTKDVFTRIDRWLDEGLPVYVAGTAGGNAAQRYIESQYIVYLKQRGMTVYYVEPGTEPEAGGKLPQGASVAFKVRRFGVGYRDVGKKENDKKLSREITVQVMCKVSDPATGRVISADVHDGSYSDSIAPESIGSVQNDYLPFTVGSTDRKKSRLREFLELGTVLSTAGVIVYLLFSTRS